MADVVDAGSGRPNAPAFSCRAHQHCIPTARPREAKLPADRRARPSTVRKPAVGCNALLGGVHESRHLLSALTHPIPQRLLTHLYIDRVLQRKGWPVLGRDARSIALETGGGVRVEREGRQRNALLKEEGPEKVKSRHNAVEPVFKGIVVGERWIAECGSANVLPSEALKCRSNSGPIVPVKVGHIVSDSDWQVAVAPVAPFWPRRVSGTRRLP